MQCLSRLNFSFKVFFELFLYDRNTHHHSLQHLKQDVTRTVIYKNSESRAALK